MRIFDNEHMVDWANPDDQAEQEEKARNGVWYTSAPCPRLTEPLREVYSLALPACFAAYHISMTALS